MADRTTLSLNLPGIAETSKSFQWLALGFLSLLFLTLNGCNNSSAPVESEPAREVLSAETVPSAPEPAADSETVLPETTLGTEHPVSAAKPLPPVDPYPQCQDLNWLKDHQLSRWEFPGLTLVSDIPQEQIPDILSGCRELIETLQLQFQQWQLEADSPQPIRYGFLMRDRQHFLEIGLLPAVYANRIHGMQRSGTFWVLEQPTPYYRRHLVFHELVHAFMPRQTVVWPIWLHEGMAEYFATHRMTSHEQPAQFEFGIMPEELDDLEGWGRIRQLNSLMESPNVTWSAISALNDQFFFQDSRHYSAAWLAVWLLKQNETLPHQTTAEAESPAVTLNQVIQRSLKPPETPGDFVGSLTTNEFAIQWSTAASELTRGYQVQVSQLQQLPISVDQSFAVSASNNWHISTNSFPAGTQLMVEAEDRIHFKATTDETISSSPYGLTYDHIQGNRLGALQWTLIPAQAEEAQFCMALQSAQSWHKQKVIRIEQPSRLAFRIVLPPGMRSSSRGEYEVRVTEISQE